MIREPLKQANQTDEKPLDASMLEQMDRPFSWCLYSFSTKFFETKETQVRVIYRDIKICRRRYKLQRQIF